MTCRRRSPSPTQSECGTHRGGDGRLRVQLRAQLIEIGNAQLRAEFLMWYGETRPHAIERCLFRSAARSQLDPGVERRGRRSPHSSWVGEGDERGHISYLGDFLFPPQPCRVARRKCHGAGAFLHALRTSCYQPTNDLDIESLELLDRRWVLAGTLLLVSHDRTFLTMS